LGLGLRKGGVNSPTLSARQQDYLEKRYLLPQPRNALGEALRRHASAAMDVSDGLVGDLAKLCAASGVSGEVEIARVSLSGAAREAVAHTPYLIETVLTGGDDYEVVFTVPPRRPHVVPRCSCQGGRSRYRNRRRQKGARGRAFHWPGWQATSVRGDFIQPLLKRMN